MTKDLANRGRCGGGRTAVSGPLLGRKRPRGEIGDIIPLDRTVDRCRAGIKHQKRAAVRGFVLPAHAILVVAAGRDDLERVGVPGGRRGIGVGRQALSALRLERWSIGGRGIRRGPITLRPLAIDIDERATWGVGRTGARRRQADQFVDVVPLPAVAAEVQVGLRLAGERYRDRCSSRVASGWTGSAQQPLGVEFGEAAAGWSCRHG